MTVIKGQNSFCFLFIGKMLKNQHDDNAVSYKISYPSNFSDENIENNSIREQETDSEHSKTMSVSQRNSIQDKEQFMRISYVDATNMPIQSRDKILTMPPLENIAPLNWDSGSKYEAFPALKMAYSADEPAKMAYSQNRTAKKAYYANRPF
jgi:hypothetical protein